MPIFLSTLAVRQQSQTIRFKSAAQMLDTFGMSKGVKNTGGWSLRSNASSAPRSSSVRIPRAGGHELFTALGSTFSEKRRSGMTAIPLRTTVRSVLRT